MLDPKQPLITVAIPTFNRVEGLVSAVRSVQRQDYPNIEILISDNASSDKTALACQELQRQDLRVRYFRQERNLGPLPNFEFLRVQSRGSFFMWLADDDTLEPDVLSRCAQFLIRNPDYVMVAGTVRYWDQGSIYMEERGFSFEQETAADRIAAFYRKVTAGGVFHGLIRTELAAGVRVKNVIGSDWCFVSDLLTRGKIKQLDFPAYNKSLIGLSLNFEEYAAVVGAGHLGRCNPLLAIVWHAAAQILRDHAIYGGLSWGRRVRLAQQVYGLLIWRLYFGLLFREPRKFCRVITRSAIRTFVPPPVLGFLNGIRHGVLSKSR